MPLHCILRRLRPVALCPEKCTRKRWPTSRDYPNHTCARYIVIRWGLEIGNMFERRQAVSWEFEAGVAQSRFGSGTFPLQSGISKDAPATMIGYSNIRVLHRLLACR